MRSIKEKNENNCTRKNRYSDEFACRCAGIKHMADNDIKLWIYQCDICRGWHLTKNERPPYFAADYLEKRGYA